MSDHLISRVWNAVNNALRVEQTIGGTAVGAGNEVPVTLAAGTAAIGKLGANSGVDIGDVDVTSLPALPAGTNNIGDVDVLSTVHPAALTTISHGEQAGAVAATQLATVTAKFVRLKARSNNAGSIYVGSSNAVTVAAGTTTTTAGFELAPGEDSGWMPASNLNLFWIIGGNAGDDLTYMVAS